MSKEIKQMEMATLTNTFKDVRDLVVLHVKGLNSLGEYTLRASLRKKKIRLQMVKNTLTRRVFAELGMNIDAKSPYWQDTTVLAWGASSIAELSRAVESELKNPKMTALYKDKVTVKGAIADGLPVPFDLAVKMPTRLEAIGEVLACVLSPGAQIAGCLVSPGGQVAGQIQTISEKKEGEGQGDGQGEAAPAATAS